MVKCFPEPVRIIDVGGTRQFWENLFSLLPRRCEITLLNVDTQDCGAIEGISSVAGDAREMPEFPDGGFDLCFSNSVIEHVGTLHDQIRMGREVRRVARGYFVQTPNRYFPLEPHFLMPLWQFYPVPLRVALLRRFDLGWLKKITDPLEARAEIEQIRLLSAAELGRIFPDATIHRETIGPFVKSLIACHLPSGNTLADVQKPT